MYTLLRTLFSAVRGLLARRAYKRAPYLRLRGGWHGGNVAAASGAKRRRPRHVIKAKINAGVACEKRKQQWRHGIVMAARLICHSIVSILWPRYSSR